MRSCTSRSRQIELAGGQLYAIIRTKIIFTDELLKLVPGTIKKIRRGKSRKAFRGRLRRAGALGAREQNPAEKGGMSGVRMARKPVLRLHRRRMFHPASRMSAMP